MLSTTTRLYKKFRSNVKVYQVMIESFADFFIKSLMATDAATAPKTAGIYETVPYADFL